MTPQFQKVIDSDHGDCTAACIATITGIPLDEIPNDHDNFYYPIIEVLAKHGWSYIEVGQKVYFWVFASLPDVLVIASVQSQKFPDRTHSIVVRVHDDRLEVVHDPNPNNEPYDLEKTEIKGWSLLIRKEGLPSG